ncbi:MAG: homocysteine S-methyltransferase family protein [Butyrivibrio sp.]|nr:homocysteine S-methyltransferase family protein [Butyrivibrio sp.]
MTKEEFKTFLNDHIVFLDGATGTNLFKAGMPAGVCPEKWILEHPETILKLQADYANAGSDIVYAPTFTGNRIKLKDYGLEGELEKINTELVKLSKEAVKGKALVAGDITMTGRQLKPVGDLDFEELIEVYKEQISVLDKAGADLIVVETMMSLQECRAAVIAAKEISSLPVMVTLTFESDGRTLYGTDAASAAICLEALGIDAIGANCSTGPDKMCDIISAMARVTNIPIIAKPNAGLPTVGADGMTEYDMGPDEFEEGIGELIRSGALVVGGCCGTTPEYIRLIHEKYGNKKLSEVSYNINNGYERKKAGIRLLSSERQSLSFGLNDPFMIVGERINPTGKKALQAQLREGNLDMVCDFATKQEEDGASVLDINVGMSGIDEESMMLKVLEEVSSLTPLPLCIDSSNAAVMEAALRIYPGRALINSISLEKGKAETFLPLAKKYGAMFILLPVNPDGLPKNNEEKINNIETLYEIASRYGLNKDDIIVDGLVATVGADKKAALGALDTIEYCYNNGFATICGLSNISFGLPQRKYINTAFLTMAISKGLTMAISNPSQELLVNSAYASDLLRNKEEADIRYIERMQRYATEDTAGKPLAKNTDSEKKTSGNPEKEIMDIIYQDVLGGNKRTVVKDTQSALDMGIEPSRILDTVLMPAIGEVGDKYDKGVFFLPQLISGAEAMKLSIALLEPLMKSEEDDKKDMPSIVIATVHGDIHDIGKNLVALMLKNYGFNVIDLGKDVPKETIIKAAIDNNASIIALSALMTTTMKEMKNVVDLAHEEKVSAKIIIGGAVVTQDYADEIGADGYSSDAADAVRVVKRILDIE